MPVGEVHMESAESVKVNKLTNIVESVQSVGRDNGNTIVSHSLVESLDVLDDSGLRQLIENAQAEFGTVLEEKGLQLMLEELLLVSLRKT